MLQQLQFKKTKNDDTIPDKKSKTRYPYYQSSSISKYFAIDLMLIIIIVQSNYKWFDVNVLIKPTDAQFNL